EAMAIADRVAVMHRGRVEQVARPPELYDSPATRFTAGFVGSRNALELPARDGVVALGSAFRVSAPAGYSGAVLAFFRPEDVEISANGGGQPATVEARTYHGQLTRLHLTAEADGRVARLYTDLPSRQGLALEPGSQVRFRVDP